MAYMNKNCIQKEICIVGIGNSLRSDDGVGILVSKQIDQMKLKGVTTMTVHQLDTGMIERLSKFDVVIFVDASVIDKSVSFQPLTLEDNVPQSFSHHINAAMLASLAYKLYSASTRFYICGICAYDFQLGTDISYKAMGNALEAVSVLTDWIRSKD